MNLRRSITQKLSLLIFLIFIFAGAFAQYPANSPVAKNGKLKVVGTNLVSECGNNVQLRGMSTHGPQWFGNCTSTSALDALVNTWGIDIYRLALYVQEGGYVNDPAGWRNWVDTWIDECGTRGIYCLIDWHVLNPGDPNANIADSRSFWQYIATKHGAKKHVLYEICNEPNGVAWSTVKTYADDIIPKIRAIDPNTVIIVGTPTWSQDVDIASTNKLMYTNVMYTLHFYSGSHFQSLRDKANTAMANGCAIFVTECGTSDASGNGGPYLAEAENWMTWMRANNISWCNWSYADKSETSAALNPGSCSGGNWNNTTTSGTYIKSKISTPADNFVSCGGVTVTLTTSPAAPTVFNEGDAVTLNATAITATGTITKVDFYDGTTFLGSSTTGPYTFPVSSLSPGSHQFRAEATNSAGLTGDATTVIEVNKAIYTTGTPPVLDGVAEALWDNATPASLNNVNTGTVNSPADLSATWQAVWDNTAIYVLVSVTDDVKKKETGNIYDDDGIEIYFDFGNTNGSTYKNNQFQYTFRLNDATIYETQHNATSGVSFVQKDPTATSYVMEVKILWSALGFSAPAINSLQGFEVMVNDDDDGGARDGKIAWAGITDNTWQDPSLMGTIILRGTVPLPVSLLDFDAEDRGSSTLVLWSTLTETQNERFELERSTDGINFATIATLPGGKNTSSLTSYEYLDQQPWALHVYYRLKTIDIDGTIHYSAIITKQRQSGQVSIAPNPAEDKIVVEFFSASSSELVLYDMYGKEIMRETIANGSVKKEYQVDSFAKGLYVLTIKNSEQLFSEKVVVR